MLDQESTPIALEALMPQGTDDNEPLVGLRAFAEFAAGEGSHLHIHYAEILLTCDCQGTAGLRLSGNLADVHQAGWCAPGSRQG